VAATAAVCTLPAALGLAWLIVRARPLARLGLESLVNLPLVLPPVVIGYFLLVLFGSQGVLGSALKAWFGLSFAFNFKGAVLAASVMALPLMVRAIVQALEALDTHDGGLVAVARGLGATRFEAFRAVVLPLISPGLVSALILGFATALGEFGATITFVSNVPGETQTLPLAIYSALQQPDAEAAAARLVGLAVLLAFAALTLAQWCNRRMLVWTGKAA
jgi:molybdate transport system permease protein